MAAALPDRARSVQDIFGWEVVSRRDFGLPGFTSPQGSAFLQKPGACGRMDGTVYTAAAQERGIGGVDDGLGI